MFGLGEYTDWENYYCVFSFCRTQSFLVTQAVGIFQHVYCKTHVHNVHISSFSQTCSHVAILIKWRGQGEGAWEKKFRTIMACEVRMCEECPLTCIAFSGFLFQSDPCLTIFLFQFSSGTETPIPGECVWNGKRFPHNSTFYPTVPPFGVVPCVNCFCNVSLSISMQ